MSIARTLLIAGAETPARTALTTDVVNPYTGEVYATVAAATPEDVTAAVDAAHAAFEGWSGLAPSVRRAVFLRAADLLESRAEQAVTYMAGEVGGARPWAEFNVMLAAGILREAAAAVTAPAGEVLSAAHPGVLGLAVRRPLGVVAAFAPWNAPIILSTRAVAAPLAAGNTVVLKASEAAPLSAGLLIADVLHEAGLPAGALNVITNDPADAAEIARVLIADARVRAVNFTGSTGVGRIIGMLAAEHLKPAVLELGGKNSVIVLADADIDYAVRATVFGAFANSGQICMSADRILVHEDIAEEFLTKFCAAVDSLPTGDPGDPHTVIGPMVNPAAAQRVSQLIADAVAKGATVRVGGGEPSAALHRATVLTGVPTDADIHHTEIFGPACVIGTFATDAEAIAQANDTEHGLSAGIITENATHGLRVAAALNTGIVHINDQSVGDEPQAPFGGVQSSGYGRFGGRWGVEAFSNTRWVTVATEQMPFPG
ncbi:aldehyde dehydrogenase family protein [Nocardia sp. SYP-A9097]|uniref:aldehyde dehydrogenase family protein n=1 Tax=Nocardia sp. SYP-A9097 TaxID=2663237 RepID=UPI00129BC62F|nr:aldehyde dehydrogenase family protein [Nocardia sp. SYP-A9097]MRH88965.1 aldehyde dehydrogenase family protein [Nocardia sp. SYP-A9097]